MLSPTFGVTKGNFHYLSQRGPFGFPIGIPGRNPGLGFRTDLDGVDRPVGYANPGMAPGPRSGRVAWGLETSEYARSQLGRDGPESGLALSCPIQPCCSLVGRPATVRQAGAGGMGSGQGWGDPGAGPIGPPLGPSA